MTSRIHVHRNQSRHLFLSQKDYTDGQLPELIDIIIKSKAALFVCAVGVPPKWAVDKLHDAGILVMK
jgi:NAD(P)H-dependent flavin oxidoreductase YrpB (nitropropane dioxygenase family)